MTDLDDLIAGEIEAEADSVVTTGPANYSHQSGLRRAAEIVRNGR